jgi:hypothetical protein
MSIRIEVKKVQVSEVAGNSRKTGKPYAFKKQAVWAYLTDKKGVPDEYPTRIEVTLDDEAQPYAPGVYTLAPSS